MIHYILYSSSASFRLKEKEILDKILGGSNYDFRIRPSGSILNVTGDEDGPVIVRVNIYVRSIARIDDVKMVSQYNTISN